MLTLQTTKGALSINSSRIIVPCGYQMASFGALMNPCLDHVFQKTHRVSSCPKKISRVFSVLSETNFMHIYLDIHGCPCEHMSPFFGMSKKYRFFIVCSFGFLFVLDHEVGWSKNPPRNFQHACDAIWLGFNS